MLKVFLKTEFLMKPCKWNQLTIYPINSAIHSNNVIEHINKISSDRTIYTTIYAQNQKNLLSCLEVLVSSHCVDVMFQLFHSYFAFNLKFEGFSFLPTSPDFFPSQSPTWWIEIPWMCIKERWKSVMKAAAQLKSSVSSLAHLASGW